MINFQVQVVERKTADHEIACEIANTAEHNRSRPSPRPRPPAQFHTVLGSDKSREISGRLTSAAGSTRAHERLAAKGKMSQTPAETTCRGYLRRGSRDGRFRPEIRECCWRRWGRRSHPSLPKSRRHRQSSLT